MHLETHPSHCSFWNKLHFQNSFYSNILLGNIHQFIYLFFISFPVDFIEQLLFLSQTSTHILSIYSSSWKNLQSRWQHQIEIHKLSFLTLWSILFFSFLITKVAHEDDSRQTFLLKMISFLMFMYLDHHGHAVSFPFQSLKCYRRENLHSRDIFVVVVVVVLSFSCMTQGKSNHVQSDLSFHKPLELYKNCFFLSLFIEHKQNHRLQNLLCDIYKDSQSTSHT